MPGGSEEDAMKSSRVLDRIAPIAALATLVACGSSSGNTPGDSGPDRTTVDASEDAPPNPTDTGMGDATPEGGTPAPPALGTQIDRMGRPAINTALNHTFDSNPSTQGAAKDAYNANNNPATFSKYVAEIKSNLAIYDGLDTVCGNQIAYGALGNPDYTTLATVLSADALWLNTASTTCAQYLGVELNALGMTNTDCGGRTLTENTIDVTYNAVAGTFMATPPPVTNGIKSPASPPTATFPYLAAPH
jgi:hypothetical protein